LLVVIGVLSLIPLDSLPKTFDFWDKLQHFLAHASLALLCFIGWYYSARIGQVLGLIAYSTGLEILQILVPASQFEWPDLLANSLGVLSALILFQLGDYWLARNSIKIGGN